MRYFQDYDYTYISDDKTSKYNKVLIEEDMFFILEGSRESNNILSVLYELLPAFIRDRLTNEGEEIEKLLKDACLDLNLILCREYTGYASLSGLIRIRNEIYSLHIGECNMVLFSGIVPVYVSTPHSMKNKKERKRIEEASFIHRSKAEGLYSRIRFFGSNNKLYYPIPDIEKINKRVTHAFLYSSKLKVDLSDLITKSLNGTNGTNETNKTSTIILNENMVDGNLCLAILHLQLKEVTNVRIEEMT